MKIGIYLFQPQKRIVSAETICGNMVDIDFHSMYLRIFDSIFLQSIVKTSIKSDVTNPEKQFTFCLHFI